MSATQPTTARAAEAPAQGDRITYGAVHLDVTDAARSLAFWRDAVGLRPVSGSEPLALGAGGRVLVVLHPGATRPVARGAAGLYHLAIHVPDMPEFARAIARLAAAGVPQGPTDHVFSMATYATAPDGFGLEITLETPERFSAFEIGPRSIVVLDDEGRRRGPTEALDLDPVIARLPDTHLDAPLPAGTMIGHVHLHVPDLDAGRAFYRDVVGFDEHMTMTAVGMADLSAGGRFPHRLALNDWHGPAAAQPPDGTAGLRRFELLVPAAADLDAIARRADASGAAATRDGDALDLTDPAGNRVRVAIRPV